MNFNCQAQNHSLPKNRLKVWKPPPTKTRNYLPKRKAAEGRYDACHQASDGLTKRGWSRFLLQTELWPMLPQMRKNALTWLGLSRWWALCHWRYTSYSRSDTNQRYDQRILILIRNCNGLSESVPHPMFPNCPLLVSLGLCGVIPRTQLKSYFLHQATPVNCSPHSHTLCHHVDYLEGVQGERESTRSPALWGLGPSKPWPPAKTETGDQLTQDPHMQNRAQKLNQPRQGWSCTWMCPH